MVETSYINVIEDLIKALESLATQDLGDPDTRHKCASVMYSAYYQISDPSEKELADKIMNDGGNLEGETVLAINHPMYDQDIKDFGNSLIRIILFLKDIKAKDR